MNKRNKKLKLKSLDVLWDNGRIGVLSTVLLIVQLIFKCIKKQNWKQCSMANEYAEYNKQSHLAIIFFLLSDLN